MLIVIEEFADNISLVTSISLYKSKCNKAFLNNNFVISHTIYINTMLFKEPFNTINNWKIVTN